MRVTLLEDKPAARSSLASYVHRIGLIMPSWSPPNYALDGSRQFWRTFLAMRDAIENLGMQFPRGGRAVSYGAELWSSRAVIPLGEKPTETTGRLHGRRRSPPRRSRAPPPMRLLPSAVAFSLTIWSVIANPADAPIFARTFLLPRQLRRPDPGVARRFPRIRSASEKQRGQKPRRLPGVVQC
jgi:hypothetical protein